MSDVMLAATGWQHPPEEECEVIMNLIERQKVSRRLDPHAEFPLTDYRDVLVVRDRRQTPDRRKAKLGLDDLKIILAKMSGK
jgi:hypothetical protein